MNGKNKKTIPNSIANDVPIKLGDKISNIIFKPSVFNSEFNHIGIVNIINKVKLFLNLNDKKYAIGNPINKQTKVADPDSKIL